MALHGRSQNAVDAGLVAPAVRLQPVQHVRVKADGELLFGRGPCRRGLFEKLPAQWRNVRVVDVRVLHPVKACPVAFDRFFVVTGKGEICCRIFSHEERLREEKRRRREMERERTEKAKPD